MIKPLKLKQYAVLGGDIVLLYLALFLMLAVRYGNNFNFFSNSHLGPFSIVFLLWLIVFYIIGFYELSDFKNTSDFRKKFWLALTINFIIAISFFYFFPISGITPKTNLFIFFLVFAPMAYIWRSIYNNFLAMGTPAQKILLLGYNQVAQELRDHITANPQLGYEIKFWLKEGLKEIQSQHLNQIITDHKINLIVVPAHIKKISHAAKMIYRNLALGIEVADLSTFSEILFHRVPLTELETVWFLENLAKNHPIHDAIKRPLEIFIAAILSIITFPIAFLIVAIIKLTSRGSAFFTQKRLGRNGEEFVLWKFRTMFADAEKDGPKWAKPKDPRITPFGKFLRRTHLDELPQIINILKGELSLVGPRPERPEFVKTLTKEIPFYELRHLVRPGLTGWAQVNYRYGASLDDAYEKLEYDIYYLKNRSLWLDFLIILKTAKRFFIQAK